MECCGWQNEEDFHDTDVTNTKIRNKLDKIKTNLEKKNELCVVSVVGKRDG